MDGRKHLSSKYRLTGRLGAKTRSLDAFPGRFLPCISDTFSQLFQLLVDEDIETVVYSQLTMCAIVNITDSRLSRTKGESVARPQNEDDYSTNRQRSGYISNRSVPRSLCKTLRNNGKVRYVVNEESR